MLTGAKSSDSITADQIAPGAITGSELAQNSVSTDHIIDETIVGGPGGDIAPDTITEYNLATGSVGPDALQPIGGDSIADGGITADKFDPSAVDRGLDVDTGAIGHTNSVTEGTTAVSMTKATSSTRRHCCLAICRLPPTLI